MAARCSEAAVVELRDILPRVSRGGVRAGEWIPCKLLWGGEIQFADFCEWAFWGGVVFVGGGEVVENKADRQDVFELGAIYSRSFGTWLGLHVAPPPLFAANLERESLGARRSVLYH